jgi:hypothetical protein
MTAAKTERRLRGALFTGALRVGLTVLACWAFNACNLNPRPEGESAADSPPPLSGNGGAGGRAGLPGPGTGGTTFTGTGGAPASSAGGGSNPGGLDASSGIPTNNPDAAADAADAAPEPTDSGRAD